MNKRLIRHLVVFFFLVSFFLGVSISVVNAQGFLNSQEGLSEIGKTAYGTTGAAKDPRVIIALLVRKFIGFLGTILLVLIVYSGFEWMTAGGDKGKIDSSKKRMTNAVIGLAIILSAYVLTDFVIGCALKVTGASDGTVFFGGVCQ